MQAHITILEGSEESKLALLQGLEYLVQISFVDDDEVPPPPLMTQCCANLKMRHTAAVQKLVVLENEAACMSTQSMVPRDSQVVLPFFLGIFPQE